MATEQKGTIVAEQKTTGPRSYPTLEAALAAFQADLPVVKKGNTARVEGQRGSYSYDYADLADVTEVALPALTAVGLAWITRPDTAEDGTINLHYSLTHVETGDAIHGHVAVGKKGDRWQDLGSALTYARRYMLVSVTGIAPRGDDNDGADARAGSAPAPVQQKQYLPAGLYDLSSVTSRKAAESMFYVARGAGHLGLYVQTPAGDEVMFGDWLRAIGSRFPQVEPEDEAQKDAADLAEEEERRVVAEHEAALAEAQATASTEQRDGEEDQR